MIANPLRAPLASKKAKEIDKIKDTIVRFRLFLYALKIISMGDSMFDSNVYIKKYKV